MYFKTIRARLSGRFARVAAIAAIAVAAASGTAFAQDDPNPGALTFTGNFDVPTVYFFRGFRQEGDPGLTMFPSGDLGIAFSKATLNLGVWNSLNTGSNNEDGFGLHYEEDFYLTLGVPLAKGLSLGTTWTAYTSPNGRFSTVQELSFKVSQASKYAPYGIIAFELGDNGADGGSEKGTYLELGVAPSWPLGPGTFAVPVKLGMSLNNYYELDGEDNKFGFFDIGGLYTVPLAGVPKPFGAWNVHFGADYLMLGDTTEAFNLKDDGGTKASQFIGLVGIGVSY